jgi:peroxiredoxin Q/BCP|tara:strand:+ start:229 stop:483 length:255 start_codon:yes stop_codon:yes gene_type:complete
MSADSVKAQKSFCDKQEFPFSLLSDPSKETIKAYGAWGPKKFMGREYEGIFRYSYLIDENGTIERVYSKVKTKTHAKDILSDLD